MRHNRATTTTIKTAMMQIGIEQRLVRVAQARKLAKAPTTSRSAAPQVCPQLLDEGPGRSAAPDPGAPPISPRSTRACATSSWAPGSRSLETITIEEAANAAAPETEPLPERLAAWLLLRDKTGASPKLMRQVLYEVMQAPEPPDPSQPPEIWKLFQALPGAKDQERSVELLPELFGTGGAQLALEAVDAQLAEANAEVASFEGEGGEASTATEDAPADSTGDEGEATETVDDLSWIEDVLPHLQHAAPGQVRPLIERLRAAGHEDELRAHYAGLLARPLRNPTLMIVLADRFEDGGEHEDMPTPVQRGQARWPRGPHLPGAPR